MGTTPAVSPSQSFVSMRKQRERCSACGFTAWQGRTRVSTPAEFRRFANTETHGEHLPMAPAPHSWQVGPTKATPQHTLLSTSHMSRDTGGVTWSDGQVKRVSGSRQKTKWYHSEQTVSRIHVVFFSCQINYKALTLTLKIRKKTVISCLLLSISHFLSFF